MYRAALAACAMWIAGCNVGPLSERPPSARKQVVREPERARPRATRAESELREMRTLIVDLAARQTCDRLRGRMMTIGGSPGEPHIGRIWLRRCDARIESPTQLALDIGAWVWTWVDERSNAVGATFEVKQYVFLEAQTTLHVSPEIDYDRERSWAYLWMRPVIEPEVATRTIGHVDADPEGVWSHVLGGVIRVFSDSPDERARGEVDEEGDRRLEEQVDDGFSVYTDLCTAETGMEMGRVRAPPHRRTWPGQPSPPTPVRVHPGGLDVHGPISDGGTQMIVAMTARRGAARGRLVCEEDMERLVEAFRRTDGHTPLPEVDALADARIAQGETEVLRAGGARACPLFIVTSPARASTATVSFTVRPAHDDSEPLVFGCRPPARHASR